MRRKLKFTNKQLETRQCDEYAIGRVLPDEIGEDTDVMHMKLEDIYQQWDGCEYTPNYLKECRHLLMKKVEEYRRTVEELQTEKAKQAVQHRNEIEEIRTFYRNIAYGTSRTGKIVKKAMSTSEAAKEVLRTIGYEQLQKQLAEESDSDFM